MNLMQSIRFVTDCVNRVAIGDIIKAIDLPDRLSPEAEYLRRKRDLLVEGITEGNKPGTVVLHLADASGAMGYSSTPVVFDGGWLVGQSRWPRERQNYRAPNGTFGMLF